MRNAVEIPGETPGNRPETGSSSHGSNRAVSALFRVFGGKGKRQIADGFERTKSGGMHGGERLVLGIIVPLTVLAGLSEWLVKWWGPVLGWLFILPLTFFALNLLAIFLPGKEVVTQWRVWLIFLTAWACWRIEAGGHVMWFAWLWLAIFVINTIAILPLGLSYLMHIGGRRGIHFRMSLFIGMHVIAIAVGWRFGWWWSIAGGALIALLYCLAVLRPACQWLGPVLCVKDDRKIWVTIDDGPDPDETPALLDLLDHYDAKAVFFMIGDKVLKHPELAREVIHRGHEIGNHTMTHPQAGFWRAGPEWTMREMENCQNAIHQATGLYPEWFRAPVGHRNLFTHPIADLLGLKVMAWSRRGYDAVQKDPGIVLKRILPLTVGDVVLMHEGTGIAVEILDGILKAKKP